MWKHSILCHTSDSLIPRAFQPDGVSHRLIEITDKAH